MSKYTEAIESLGIIFKCNACDMEVVNCMECDFLHDTCLEALQIADRLEQVDARQIVRKVICDICCEAETCGQGELGDWCCEYGAILKAIKLALADIRGDNNG